MKPTTVGVVIVAGFFAVAGVHPASAHVDLSGMWAPIFHEDQVERVPGLEIGDYSGLPINDAERMRADSVSRGGVSERAVGRVLWTCL